MTPTSDEKNSGAFMDGAEESSAIGDASMSYGGMHERGATESVTDGPDESFDAGQILKDRAENLRHVDRDAFRRVPTFQESPQDNTQSSAGTNFRSDSSVDANRENQGNNPIMQVGVLVVLGAVAANVFGFRSSRWAVGKELFRAWERRSRRSAAREAAEAAARAAARAAAQTAARRAAEWARQASARAASTAASGSGSSGRQSARSAFGFRNAAAASGINDNGRRNGTPRDAFEAAEEMLRELLRETERATGRSSGVGGGARRPRGMDAWEELFDEAVRDAQRATRNEGSTGQGVYGRWEWRGEWGPDGNVRWERMGGFGNAQAGNPFGTGQEQSGAGSAGFNPFEQVSDARYYRALGLQPGASEQEVKNAYRKLVMKWHPDRYRGNNKEEAERKFREITHAYEALTKR